MPGLCEEHVHKKTKSCEECGGCPFCPPKGCRSKRHREVHAGADRGRGRPRGKVKGIDASKDPPRRSGRKRRGSSVSECLASYEAVLDDTLFERDQDDGREKRPKCRFRVKKDRLLVSSKMQERCKEQLCRVGKRAMNEEAKKICPEDPKLVKNMCSPHIGFVNEKLTQKICELAMGTTGTVSELCYTLLASVAESPEEMTTILNRARMLHPTVEIDRAHIGWRRFASLKQKSEHVEQGQTASLKRYFKKGRVNLKKENVRQALEWIHGTLPLRPSKLRSFRVGNVLVDNMHVMYLDTTYQVCYKKYCKAISQERRIGEKIFRSLLKRLTDRTKAEAGLSYYYTDFIELVAEAGNMMKRAATLISEENLPIRFKEKFEALEKELEAVAHFVKHDYPSHLEKDSSCANHCMRHALGGKCNHQHKDACEECDRVIHLPKRIESTLEEIPESASPSPEFQTMKKAVKFVVQEFDRFSAHILRTKWQHEAIEAEIAAAVQSEDTAVIIIDHKQKILARRLKESQMQYYAKRGLSLLGAMIILGVDEDDDIEQHTDDIIIQPEDEDCPSASTWSMQIGQHEKAAEKAKAKVRRRRHHFVDIVPQNTAEQKACITCACLEALLEYVAKHFPHIKFVQFGSDNAGPFSAQTLAPFFYLLNIRKDLPKVIGWTFSEAQSGKTMLDCHFAYLNIWIDAWVREGKGKNILMDSETLFQALAHDGGVKNSSAILVKLNLQNTYAIHSESNELRPNVLNHQKPGSNGVYASGQKKGLPRPAIWKLKMGVRKCHAFSLGQNPTAYEQSDLLKPELLPFDLLERKTPITLKPEIIESTKTDITFGKKKEKQKTVPRMPPAGYVHRGSDDLVAGEIERLKETVVGTTTPVLKTRRSMSWSPITVAQRQASWAEKSSRDGRVIDADVVERLAALYSVGVRNKTKKISSEAAYRQVKNSILKRWDQRFLVTPGKVKSMFSLKNGPQLTKAQKKAVEVAQLAAEASSSKVTPGDPVAEDDNESVQNWICEQDMDILDYDIDSGED